MSTNDILYMALGYDNLTESRITYWPRSTYDDIALMMKLKPSDYKNKIEIFNAIGVELPYYLIKNPKIKDEIKENIKDIPNHYLYNLVNTTVNTTVEN